MNVTLRKYLSVLLLSIYCLSVGGGAYAALTCHCDHTGADHVHLCCLDCEVHTDCNAHTSSIKSTCCGAIHSTAIELYTSVSPSSSERDMKIMIVDLPDALATDSPMILYTPTNWIKISERPLLSRRTVQAFSCGLRAPPVFV